MNQDVATLTLARVHERKLLQAIGVLEQARDGLRFAAADARASAHAFQNEPGQAQRRSHELIGEAKRLVSMAERLVVEARAVKGEQTAGAGVRQAEVCK